MRREKMQLSNYEIILPLKDKAHYLLVNGLYVAMDVVDKACGQALLAGNLDALSEEEKMHLLSRGHIADSSEREREDLEILAAVDRKLDIERSATLLMLPTYDCNFRCPYCFERHRLSCGKEWLKKTMSKDLVDAVFEAVDKERQRGAKVDGLGLYGGEPFLKENVELIRYISKKAIDAGMTLDAVTNGYDLEYYTDILKEFKYRQLQITLDGVKEDNDKRRLYTGGGGSYEKILENIGLALDNGIKTSIRINVGPENIKRVHELTRVFKERGFTDNSSFHYYYAPTDDEYYPGKDHGVRYRDIVDMLVDNGYEVFDAMKCVSHYSSIIEGIQELIDKKEYYNAAPYHCGAESNMYLVDPEGNIFTCWDFVAMEEMTVGRINMEKRKFAFKFDLLKWNYRTVDNIPECVGCPYLFACGGGCAARAYKEKGDAWTFYCGQIKEIFNETALEVCGRAFEKTGERELSKSLKEMLSVYTPEERKDLITSRDANRLVELIKKGNPQWKTTKKRNHDR
jgi:uncharacterized protein